MELPKGWTDFKFVENGEGCFVPQIRLSDKQTDTVIDTWDTKTSKDRLLLIAYAKQELEKLTGHKVLEFK